MKEEVCANCGHKIGRLEEAYSYKDNVVCQLCYNRLELMEEANNSGQKLISKRVDLPSKGKWSGFCIAAFVISLLNVPLFDIEIPPDAGAMVIGITFILFILSIVFAGIGLSQVGKNPGMRGKGLGIAALIISIVSFFLVILL